MEQSIRTLQIVVLALVGGVVAFTVVALAVDLELPANDTVDAVFPFLLPMLAIGNVMAYALIRRNLLGRLKRGLADDGAPLVLPAEITSLVILGAALAEAVALFGIIGYWLTRQPAFLLAPAVAVLLMLLGLPTRQKIDRLLETLRLR